MVCCSTKRQQCTDINNCCLGCKKKKKKKKKKRIKGKNICSRNALKRGAPVFCGKSEKYQYVLNCALITKTRL